MKKILSSFLVLLTVAFVSPRAILASEFTSGQVIVSFRSSLPSARINQFIASHGLKLNQSLLLPQTFIMIVPSGLEEKLSLVLSNSPLVEYAEPNYTATILETPNDPLFPQQWGLSRIQAPLAWDVATSSGDVDLAVIDTGIDGSHPDLSDRVVARANFTADPDLDNNGHGSHVAGIAAANTNNSLGIAGLDRFVRLISVKVLNSAGSGSYSQVADGIIWAADNGAEVINLSLGGSFGSKTLQNAIKYASDKGVVIAAAAGNNGRSSRTYPAYYSQAIAVAATDQNDLKAYFSNYGSWVDVAAPGVSILSTTSEDYQSWSGTSMATPFVAGLATLIKGQHPTWSSTQVRSQLETTADDIFGTGRYWTHGRINACKAIGSLFCL